MLKVEKVNTGKNFRILEHEDEVFHKALQYVLLGERNFHVKRDGEYLYDLNYVENQVFAEQSPAYVHSPVYDYMPLYPPYLTYDEKDVEKICFEQVEQASSIWFEKVSEYSVVIAKLLLQETAIKVYFADPRIRWFIEDERVEIAEEDSCPEAMKIYHDFVPSAFDSNFKRMDAMVLFHHLFMLQWLTPLKLSDIKYVELTIPVSEGIGSMLLAYGRGKEFFEKRYGFTVTIKAGSSRYDDDMLKKYFNLKYTPEDSNEKNTVYVINYFSIMYSKALRRRADIDDSLFQEEFLADMKLYAGCSFKGRKVLGLLLRGSDYLSSQMGGNSRPASMQTIMDRAKEWKEKYGYEKIFLATEDGDILDAMREAFPGDIMAVAQERYRVSDFTDELRTISDIDRARHPDREDYDSFTEDVMVNYFYAMYMLAQCDSFIYSCHCCGVSLARMFNGDRFERMLCLSDGRERAKVKEGR